MSTDQPILIAFLYYKRFKDCNVNRRLISIFFKYLQTHISGITVVQSCVVKSKRRWASKWNDALRTIVRT